MTEMAFSDWQHRLERRIRCAMESTIPHEVPCVQAIVNAASEGPCVVTAPTGRCTLSIESAFIHGNRSRVKFKVGSRSCDRELADLLVLATLAEQGKVRSQRVCFIQAKRATKPSQGQASVAIQPDQLHLLRVFPPFTGSTGIFRGMSVDLQNTSGMLGAFGFLTTPGEIAILGCPQLYAVLGGRKQVTMKEIGLAIAAIGGRQFWSWWPRVDLEFRLRHHVPSVTSCVDLSDFISSWTGFLLGECWQRELPSEAQKRLFRVVHQLTRRVAKPNGSGGLPQLGSLLDGLAKEIDEGSSGDGDSTSHESGDAAGGFGIVSHVIDTTPGP